MDFPFFCQSIRCNSYQYVDRLHLCQMLLIVCMYGCCLHLHREQSVHGSFKNSAGKDDTKRVAILLQQHRKGHTEWGGKSICCTIPANITRRHQRGNISFPSSISLAKWSRYANTNDYAFQIPVTYLPEWVLSPPWCNNHIHQALFVEG